MIESLAAVGDLVTPIMLFWLFLGVVLGIVVGAIPGLTGAMLIALTLPMTYYMASNEALVLLVAMYVGAITGGLITATLFAIPGTASSIVTTFDGPPMVARGLAGRALGLGIMGSFFGGFISWLFLASLSRPMAELALHFSPFDYFAIVMLALVLMAAVSKGSMLKGLLSGFLGILVAMPGLDPSSATVRFDFGIDGMLAGFGTLPVLVGIFAIAIVFRGVYEGDASADALQATVGRVVFSLKDVWRQGVNLIRSSVIGTWVGILPGVGGSVASILSYTIAKNASRTPEKFGTGHEEGIVASEAGNNASICGALIPLVAMGIPGSVIDVMLLGALMVHNLQPGPLLFRTNPDTVNAIIAAALLGHVIMLGVMLAATGWIARIARVPRSYLLPIILIFCVVGTFAANNRMFDVWVMLGFGLVGLLFVQCRVPPGPFVIGFILAPIAETNLRSGLMASGGSYWPLVTEPLTVSILIASVGLLLWPFLRRRGGMGA